MLKKNKLYYLILLIATILGIGVSYFADDDTDWKIKAAFKDFGINIPIFTSKGIE